MLRQTSRTYSAPTAFGLGENRFQSLWLIWIRQHNANITIEEAQVVIITHYQHGTAGIPSVSRAQ